MRSKLSCMSSSLFPADGKEQGQFVSWDKNASLT